MIQEKNQTWFEKHLPSVKRHPVVIAFSVFFAVIIWLGTVTNSIDSILRFFKEHVASSAYIAPRGRDTTTIVQSALSAQAPSNPNKIVQPQSSETAESSVSISSDAPSAEEVFRTIKDKNLTDLQRSQFIDRTTGMRVKWGGSIAVVQRMYETDKESPIDVILDLNIESESSFPAMVGATFPHSAEADLSSLSKGDYVSISCRLGYMNDTEPTLSDCKLITFTKNSK